MSRSRALLLSAFAGRGQRVHIDAERPNDLIVEDIQDCERIIEMAKRLSEREPGKDFRHVGIMPAFQFNKMAREGSLNDEKALKRWINDPDNKAFRTWPGNV